MLLVFLMAAVLAISLYMEIPRVAFDAQRQKEQLLIERGEQYKRAIQVFFVNNKRYPVSMDELKNLNGRRYLRQQYLDPMTGKSEWRLVHINGGVFTDSLLNTPKQGQQGQAQQAQNQQGQGQQGGITGGTYVGEGQLGIGVIPTSQQSVNPAMRRRASDGGPMTPDQMPGGFPPQTDSAGNVIGGPYPAGGLPPDQNAQTGAGVTPGVQSPTAPGAFPMAQPNTALPPNSAAQPFAASGFQASPGGQVTGGIGTAPTNIGQAQINPGVYNPPNPVSQGFPSAGQQPSVPMNPQLPPGLNQFGSQPFQPSQQASANSSSAGASSYVSGSQSYIGGGSYVGGQSPMAGAQTPAFGSSSFGQNGAMGFPGAPVNSQMGGVSPTPMMPTGYSGSGVTPSTYSAPVPPPAPYSTQPGAQGASPGFPQPGMQTGAAPGQPGAPGQSPASNMIWNILTSPRTNPAQGTAVGQNPQIGGGGIAGIASKSEDEAIMIYDDRSKYNEWEFIFDLTKYRQPPNPLAGSVGTSANQIGTPASQLGSNNQAPNATGGIPGAGGLNMGGQQGAAGPGFGNSGPGNPNPAGAAPSPSGQTGFGDMRLGQP